MRAILIKIGAFLLKPVVSRLIEDAVNTRMENLLRRANEKIKKNNDDLNSDVRKYVNQKVMDMLLQASHSGKSLRGE
jgi:hypothetical protein